MMALKHFLGFEPKNLATANDVEKKNKIKP